jgi:hypothetical protein
MMHGSRDGDKWRNAKFAALAAGCAAEVQGTSGLFNSICSPIILLPVNLALVVILSPLRCAEWNKQTRLAV